MSRQILKICRRSCYIDWGTTKCIGTSRHVLGTMNNNGSRIVEFYEDRELVIWRNFNPIQKKFHKITWTLPNGTTDNQIYHIAVSTKWRKYLLHVRSRRGAECGSDLVSDLVTADIRLNVASPRVQLEKIYSLWF